MLTIGGDEVTVRKNEDPFSTHDDSSESSEDAVADQPGAPEGWTLTGDEAILSESLSSSNSSSSRDSQIPEAAAAATGPGWTPGDIPLHLPVEGAPIESTVHHEAEGRRGNSASLPSTASPSSLEGATPEKADSPPTDEGSLNVAKILADHVNGICSSALRQGKFNTLEKFLTSVVAWRLSITAVPREGEEIKVNELVLKHVPGNDGQGPSPTFSRTYGHKIEDETETTWRLTYNRAKCSPNADIFFKLSREFRLYPGTVNYKFDEQIIKFYLRYDCDENKWFTGTLTDENHEVKSITFDDITMQPEFDECKPEQPLTVPECSLATSKSDSVIGDDTTLTAELAAYCKCARDAGAYGSIGEFLKSVKIWYISCTIKLFEGSELKLDRCALQRVPNHDNARGNDDRSRI